MSPKRHLDIGSLVVIGLTFLLFAAALFAKGFSEELLLEAGVFLVSVKLIIMAYKDNVASRELLRRIEQLQSTVNRLESPVDRSAERQKEPGSAPAN
jgi:hypothetical protein